MLENLDVIKDWNIETSGGEKKKIEAMRLFMLYYKMQPDFIFLDEVFAGVDQSSINSMQVMFNKYFNNSQIFVIDHEWESHNFNKWYSGLLALSNNTLHFYTAEDYT
jgi:ABC-type lipopolysaccharide export system ATPase subunit